MINVSLDISINHIKNEIDIVFLCIDWELRMLFKGIFEYNGKARFHYRR